MIYSLHDDLICRLCKAGCFASVLIICVSFGQSFRSEIPRVSEWFVYAFEKISTGHEDLEECIRVDIIGRRGSGVHSRTLSKAVEHARGCVATVVGGVSIYESHQDDESMYYDVPNIGLFDMLKV